MGEHAAGLMNGKVFSLSLSNCRRMVQVQVEYLIIY